MFKDIRYTVGFLFLVIFILGFFIKITLFSNIKEYELRTEGKTLVYVGKEVNEVINDDVIAHVTMGGNLYNRVIVPYLLSYIRNSGEYKYGLEFFYKLDDVENIMISFMQNNKIISSKIIDKNSFNRNPQLDGYNMISISHQNVCLKEKELDNLKFIIEFDGLKDGKMTHYKVSRNLQKTEKKYFGNMYFYFLGRNF